jgi:hypothetical protein
LEVLEERENNITGEESLAENQRLPTQMKTSWNNEDFWASQSTHAAWESGAFDGTFWGKLCTNPRLFKDNHGYKEGFELLSEEAKKRYGRV